MTHPYFWHQAKRVLEDLAKQPGIRRSRSLTMDAPSACSNVGVLDLWLSQKVKSRHSVVAINRASENGHIAVLDWWKKSGLVCKYSKVAMDLASMNGRVEVLQWWIMSAIGLTRSEKFMGCARSGLLKYSNVAMDGASERGHVHVLSWWADSGLIKLEFSVYSMAWPSRNGHTARMLASPADSPTT
jgi:hypothetical protein